MRNILQASFPGLTAQEQEDIGQDARLKLCRLAGNGAKIGNLRSYIWKIVYTAAIDLLNRRLTAQSLDGLLERSDATLTSCLDDLTPEVLGEKKELLGILREAVDTLPTNRRKVVKLHLLGMDRREIAVFLSWGEGRVRHLLNRGLADLRDMVRARAFELPPEEAGKERERPTTAKRIIGHDVSE